MNFAAEPARPSARRVRVVLILAWLTGWLIVAPAEWTRWRSDDSTAGRSFALRALSDWNIDATPWFWLLLAAPFVAMIPPKRPSAAERTTGAPSSVDGGANASSAPKRNSETRPVSVRRTPWIALSTVAVLAWASSLWVSLRPVDPRAEMRFGDLPPAYHDEYSYLFQAKTFLAGRLWMPSHPTMPGLFDQMHVLNEGKFASRYFPGAGAWMAPFVAMGNPWAGHRLAAAILAVCVFLAGMELGGFRTGMIAGTLTALSPGLALFSNLLLAHHPTLVGLGVFLVAMLRLMKQPTPIRALVAGSGLSFAMLCRPMTAAGFALPFGAWMAAWIVEPLWRRGSHPLFPKRARIAALMAAPLLAGFAVLMIQNKAITGDALTTPYRQYTDIYTPRHVYGFDNVVRGEAKAGPKTLEGYDRWADNLTPELALRNEKNRWIASAQWTLGIVPLAIGLVLFAGFTWPKDRRWLAIAASTLSLHLVHVPYWFDGIMHWHYVFETAPLLLLMTAGATVSLEENAPRVGWNAIPMWWMIGLGATLATAYATLDALAISVMAGALGFVSWIRAVRVGASRRPAWVAFTVAATAFSLAAVWPSPLCPVARLDAAVSEVGYSRRKYAEFHSAIQSHALSRPALVLVKPDPSDRHVDFVVNDPALNSPLLIGRWRADLSLESVRKAFPGRTLYRADPSLGVIRREM